VRELTRKYWLSYWRDPGYNFTRVLLSLLFAIIFGVIYFMAASSKKATLRVGVSGARGARSCCSCGGGCGGGGAGPLAPLGRWQP
jgi:hypothetical protein